MGVGHLAYRQAGWVLGIGYWALLTGRQVLGLPDRQVLGIDKDWI